MKSAKKNNKKKPNQNQALAKKRQRGPNPNLHWVIKAGKHEPIYFSGNEEKADARRVYHGVQKNCKAWKRRATPEEIKLKMPLSGITQEQIVYTPYKKKPTILLKIFPTADPAKINEAIAIADEQMRKNKEKSDEFYKKHPNLPRKRRWF